MVLMLVASLESEEVLKVEGTLAVLLKQVKA